MDNKELKKENQENSIEEQEDNEQLELETEEAIDEQDERLYQLDLQMEELIISMEKIEDSYSPDDYEELQNNEQYIELKKQYKDLQAEKKIILKDKKMKDTSKLNEVSIWVVIFGIISFIISFPLVSSTLWMDFAVWLLDLFSETFANLNTDGFLHDMIVFLVIFSLPLLINLITWLVHNNFIKSKTDKKVFIGFWIVQAAMSIGMIIYMCTLLYGA